MGEIERFLLRAALGLPQSRDGFAFRNAYVVTVATPEWKAWESMVEKGWARPAIKSNLHSVTYRVTPSGAEAIDARLPEDLGRG